MEHCKYKFVKNELENRNMQELQNKLCICYDAISEVRKWANYIKHKGGVDYKFLNAPKPFGLFGCVVMALSNVKLRISNHQ